MTTLLSKLLDKDFADKTPEELVNAPVDALKGVSPGDAAKLKEAFNIKTIGDLANNKYFAAAQVIAQLAALK